MRTPPHPWFCLSVAAALAAGLVGAFIALALQVWAGNAALAAVDRDLGAVLLRLASGPAGGVLTWLSALHGPRGILLLTALASAVLWRWPDRAGLAVLLASVLGGASINHLLKHGLQRPRPGLEQAVAAATATATDFSFPSGHVANATLLYGTMAALVVLSTASRPLRVAAVAAAAAMVLGIACSRVALGAHRVSDVAAGLLVGLAWMTLCLAARCALRRSGYDRRHHPLPRKPP